MQVKPKDRKQVKTSWCSCCSCWATREPPPEPTSWRFTKVDWDLLFKGHEWFEKAAIDNVNMLYQKMREVVERQSSYLELDSSVLDQLVSMGISEVFSSSALSATLGLHPKSPLVAAVQWLASSSASAVL